MDIIRGQGLGLSGNRFDLFGCVLGCRESAQFKNPDDAVMFKALKSLFSKSDELKPDEYTVYTVHEGKEYVSHDGLGLKAPQPESEPEPVPEPMVTFPDWQDISQAGGILEDSETESVTNDESLNPPEVRAQVIQIHDRITNAIEAQDASEEIGRASCRERV